MSMLDIGFSISVLPDYDYKGVVNSSNDDVQRIKMNEQSGAPVPINFSKLDAALQYQFVQLCSPVLRHALHSSSKYFSPFDRHRPRQLKSAAVMVTSATTTEYLYVPKTDQFIVATGKIILTRQRPQTIAHDLSRLIRFNVRAVEIMDSTVTLEDFKLLTDSRVTSLYMSHVVVLKDADERASLTEVLDQVPYLDDLTLVMDEFPENWERSLSDWRQQSQIKSMCLQRTSADRCQWWEKLVHNGVHLARFMRRQDLQVCVKIDLSLGHVPRAHEKCSLFWRHFRPSFWGNMMHTLIVIFNGIDRRYFGARNIRGSIQEK